MRAGSIFILSPARTDGLRAAQLFHPQTKSALGLRLQKGEEIPLGEIFSFMSGLYFRGKLTYARHFGGEGPIFVITSNQGLVSVDMPLSGSEIQSFTGSAIDAGNDSYRRPLEIDLAALSRSTARSFVFLGSLSSPKYLKILSPFLQGRLYAPRLFRGMGDMQRGAVLLKSVRDNRELDYDLV